VSEFSNSLHVVSDDQDAGIGLLTRASVAGWVFPPANGWVTVVIDNDDLLPAPPGIIAANDGLLLDYINAEDHGWMFRLFRGRSQLNAYQCSWDGDLEADVSALDIDQFAEVLSAALQRPLDRELLRSLFRVASIEDVFGDFTGGNPGHKLARAVGLEHYEWLSGYYMRLPDSPTQTGVEYVG
jgi:hypothetical protein